MNPAEPSRKWLQADAIQSPGEPLIDALLFLASVWLKCCILPGFRLGQQALAQPYDGAHHRKKPGFMKRPGAVLVTK